MDLSALQSLHGNCLVIAWDKVNGLVAPFSILALDVKHDSFDRLFARELNSLAIFPNLNFQSRYLYGGKVDELERLRPKKKLELYNTLRSTIGRTHQFE